MPRDLASVLISASDFLYCCASCFTVAEVMTCGAGAGAARRAPGTVLVGGGVPGGSCALGAPPGAGWSDAAKAAAIGAGFAGAGAAAASGLKWVNNKWVSSKVAEANKRIETFNKESIRPANVQLAAQHEAQLVKERAKYVQDIPETGAVKPYTPRGPVTPIPQMEKFTPETFTTAIRSGELVPKTAAQNFTDYLKQHAPGAVIGAVTGAGAGYLAGDGDTYLTPLLAGTAGAVLGGAKAKVVNEAFQNWMLKNPGAAEKFIGAGARAAGQTTAQYATQPEAMGVFKQDENVSPIRREINRIDAQRAQQVQQPPAQVQPVEQVQPVLPENEELARALGLTE